MPIYDVVDGKQRLETIFMFSKVSPFKRDGFDVKFRFPDDDDPDWYDWNAVERYGHGADFLTYKIQVAEVRGDLSDIIELFVRINSTGKALTSSEKAAMPNTTPASFSRKQRSCRGNYAPTSPVSGSSRPRTLTV